MNPISSCFITISDQSNLAAQPAQQKFRSKSDRHPIATKVDTPLTVTLCNAQHKSQLANTRVREEQTIRHNTKKLKSICFESSQSRSHGKIISTSRSTTFPV